MNSKKMKFVATISAATILSLGAVGCGKKVKRDADRSINIEKAAADYNGQELTFRFASSNGNELISYNQANPVTLPNGVTLTKGQTNLLPMWSAIAEKFNVKIVDNAKVGTKATEQIPLDAIDNFAAGHVYGGNSTADVLMKQGIEGGLINISKHIDQMPNLKAYFAANPGIKTEVTAADGNIYYLPYVAEIGNWARLYHMRTDWVEKLLDESPSYDTGKSITLAYETFYDESKAERKIKDKVASPKTGVSITKPQSTVIAAQKSAASNGTTLNGEQACTSLKTYINDNYVGAGKAYTKASELYVGEKASYQADELVALLRCVKTNPGVLLGDSSAEVVTYFERKGSDRPNIFHLLNFFGIRSFGADTYSGRWIVNKDGGIDLAWTQPEFLDGLEILNKIFKEGLIQEDYDSNNSGTDNRATLYAQGNGFMTNDFPQSTAGFNKDNPTTATELKNTGVNVVLPAYANIQGKWGYFVENTRGAKPDGWSIAASAPDGAVAKALQIFDYIYSPEGNIMQNYGPKDLTWSTTAPMTINGKTVDVPQFLPWVTNTYSSDISKFLRTIIGSQLAIGYGKEIGFELQNNNNATDAAWDLMNNSTTTSLSYSKEAQGVDKVGPSIISVGSDEAAELATLTVSDMFDKTNDFFYVVRFGYTGSTGTTEWSSRAGFEKKLKDNGLERYIEIYQDAYKNR